MKKFATLAAIVLMAVISFTSCVEEKTDYIISWRISACNLQHFDTYHQEFSAIYGAFDEAFERATFGTIEEAHTIIARGLSPRQIKKVNKEATELANDANEALKDFEPQNSYTVTVSGLDLDTNNTLATFHYGPEE